MFMGNVGVLSLSLLHGGAHAIIFIYLFFPAEILDMLSVISCSLCEWSASQQ